MTTMPGQSQTGWRGWYGKQSRIARICVWLGTALLLGIIMDTLGVAPALGVVLIVFSSIGLFCLLPILLYRWITRQLLWGVRNRLVVTYLLLTMAPIVLFGILGSIAMYLFAGQYATNTALSLLDSTVVEVSDETASAAALSLQGELHVDEEKKDKALTRPAKTDTATRMSIAVLRNNRWQPLLQSNGSEDGSPFVGEAPPAWLQPPFRGMVAHKGRLYLCSESLTQEGGGTVLLLGSMPLDSASMAEITQGVGRVTLFANEGERGKEPEEIDEDGVKIRQEAPRAIAPGDSDENFQSVQGGVLARPASFFDKPVFFSSPAPVISWTTGKELSSIVWVISRPTLLYKRLFARSVEIGAMVRASLAGIAFAFALVELLAVLMAAGLSRTITRSVADLSRGTKEIDRGNLGHRVRVAKHDQLGELATSFNGMAASISDLLVQQREKDRLLNELAIAQEVQTTLFPASPASMPGLEMHAVCLPAQTVGGDYFDFIFGPANAVCLALGDISGKGISAALLMASLHSAVRAFSLDGGGVEGGGPGEAGSGGSLLSPAILLEDINRHLYRSTQSARYATLFVACYDPTSRTLTYSNGGHLPPLVVSGDGTVRRLECGGPVVGLLGGLQYEQAKVELQKGDLLIAFTDGLTEPENGREEFGEERLLECVRRNAILPLPDIMAKTLRQVQEWIGEREQPDDITLLLARQL